MSLNPFVRCKNPACRLSCHIRTSDRLRRCEREIARIECEETRLLQQRREERDFNRYSDEACAALDKVDIRTIPVSVRPANAFSELMLRRFEAHAAYSLEGSFDDAILRLTGIREINFFNMNAGDLAYHCCCHPGLCSAPTRKIEVSEDKIEIASDRIVTDPWRGDTFGGCINENVASAGSIAAFLSHKAAYWFSFSYLPEVVAIGANGQPRDDNHRITHRAIFGESFHARPIAEYVVPTEVTVWPVVDQFGQISFDATWEHAQQAGKSPRLRIGSDVARLLLDRSARLGSLVQRDVTAVRTNEGDWRHPVTQQPLPSPWGSVRLNVSRFVS